MVDHMDDLMVPINNTLPDEDDDQLHASGLDAAVGVMSMAVGGAKKDDQHPERRLKVATLSLSPFLNLDCRRCISRSTSAICRR